MLRLLQILGLGLRMLPEAFLSGISTGLGWLLANLPGRRRHLLASLYRVYPHWSHRRRKRHARRTAAHTVEMGILSLVSPFWSKKRCMDRITVMESVTRRFTSLHEQKAPQTLLIPHLTLVETLSWIAPKTGVPYQHITSLYRPFNNRALDDWMRRVRSRFGMKLTSRKNGYHESIAALREGRFLALLFDQHAGDAGALISFCGQVASASTLPETLRRKTGAASSMLWVERTGFGRGRLHLDPLPDEGPEDHLTLQAHQWLERKLLEDPSFSENWLWLHRRWKIRTRMHESLTLRHRRSLLNPSRDFSDPSRRRLGCRLRLPQDPGAARALLPVVRAMREARPDFLLTVLGPASLPDQLSGEAPPWDHFEPAPTSLGAACRAGLRSRAGYPEISFLFDTALRTRIEVLLSGSPHRWGWTPEGRGRWGLNGTAPQPTTRPDDPHWVSQHLSPFGWTGEADPSPATEPANHQTDD